MEINEAYLRQLLAKMDALNRKQDVVQHELNQLRREVEMVKNKLNFGEVSVPEVPVLDDPVSTPLVISEPVLVESPDTSTAVPPVNPPRPTPKRVPVPPKKGWKMPVDFEKFIGENLISKIGILILVMGAAIGGRYAINNDFINPMTRIILGYILGVGMVITAFKLKKDYEKLSAVIISGAVTILYFMTFFAHNFYGIIPQEIAFGVMAVLTVFTVVAALNYNRQIIAVLGLVGSYAVPFLLSSDNGGEVFMFSYMAIINVGVLLVSVRKYWKALYHLAFFITYGIFGFWVVLEGYRVSHQSVVFTFGIIYFLTFYAAFLGYKLWRLEKFVRSDVALVLMNAFIFYGLGFYVLSKTADLSNLLGLFTLLNALVHFGVSALIYKYRLADKSLFYLISGLVLVFITIAVPVQLEGNWVPMIWLAEAVLLFWIARKQDIYFYEKMSYVGMVLSLGGLVASWDDHKISIYSREIEPILPILNPGFLLNALFVIGFGLLAFLHFRTRKHTDVKKENTMLLLTGLLPGIFITILYLTFFIEIELFWTQGYNLSAVVETTGEERTTIPANDSYLKFNVASLFIYSMLFFSILAWINLRFIKSKKSGVVSLALMGLTLFMFITGGQEALLELWNNWVDRAQFPDFNRTIMHLVVRYLSLAAASVMIIMSAKTIKAFFQNKWLDIGFMVIFHLSILAILSFELTGWMDMKGSLQPHRFGLSILWGAYALGLIGWGIYKQNKYLRYLAFAIFGLTLIKFFLYDFAGLDTIGKTVVLISLGVLLLVIPFLYKKYENAIAEK